MTPDTLTRTRAYQGVGVVVALLIVVAMAAGHIVSIVGVTVVVAAVVLLHEAGHFVAAKLSGMKVTEFFVGYGPR
jgi:hypothetical protein